MHGIDPGRRTRALWTGGAALLALLAVLAPGAWHAGAAEEDTEWRAHMADAEQALERMNYPRARRHLEAALKRADAQGLAAEALMETGRCAIRKMPGDTSSEPTRSVKPNCAASMRLWQRRFTTPRCCLKNFASGRGQSTTIAWLTSSDSETSTRTIR